MEVKLLLSSKDILNNKFTADVKGYRAIEVDKYLDKIISDYQLMEKLLTVELPAISKQNELVTSLKKTNHDLEVSNARMKTRLGNIKEEDKVNLGNIDLVKRIRVLEKALYDAGIDPTKIK